MTIDYALYKQAMEYLTQNTPTKHPKRKPRNTTKSSPTPP